MGSSTGRSTEEPLHPGSVGTPSVVSAVRMGSNFADRLIDSVRRLAPGSREERRSEVS